MSSDHLRLCSYNIHKGFSTSNRRFLLDDMRSAIRSVNANLICLQEVVGENTRKPHLPQGEDIETQFEFLADELWPHYAYGKNAIYDHGHHGNAILSSFPFQHWKNIDASMLSFSQRGILHGHLDNGVHIFCVHMGLFAIERRFQARCLVEMIQREVDDDTPYIIAGDLNDWSLRIDRYLTQTLQVSAVSETPYPTFPSRFPMLAMDRIYYRNLTLLGSETLSGHPWRRLSDHCPLYAEFST